MATMVLGTDAARAAERGDVEMVKQVLDRGTHVDARSVFQTCLVHIAARQGHADMLEMLIARGANVNALDYVPGCVVLHKLAQMGR